MNRKGGVPSTLVTVWSLIIWTLLIIAFIILFQLTAKVSNLEPGEVERNATLTGKLNPRIEQRDRMLSYLNTPIKTCSFAQEKNMTYDLTYAEMIRLFMKGDPLRGIESGLKWRDTYKTESTGGLIGKIGPKKEVTPKLVYDDPHEGRGWENESYIKHMHVWDVCTDIYFNGVSEGMSINEMIENNRFNYLYQLWDKDKDLILAKDYGDGDRVSGFEKTNPRVSIPTEKGKVYFTLTPLGGPSPIT